MTGRRRPAWSGSTRRRRLPPDWPARRQLAAARAGGRCEWWRVLAELGWRDDPACSRPGTDADHIHRGDDHRPQNLAWICGPHHDLKSSREGAAARPRLNRPTEPHPGIR